MPSSDPILIIHDVYKSFGATRALQGVSLEARRDEITAVLGPSGCGKSTLLGLVAGLDQPDAGEILWEGSPLAGVPPHRRGFGLMFQDFALFPHMDVFENIAFGLRLENLPASRIQQRVKEMLALVGMAGFEHRDVNTLSGGEQQRVALARSLAPQPKLLMLDEPLGALDRTLRERLLADLRRILRGIHQTTLYVTHDQEEAFTLAGTAVVMNAGRVEQSGPPEEIYRHPASLFVARFLGLNNLLPGKVRVLEGRTTIDTAIGSIPFPAQLPTGQERVVLIRPEAASLDGRGSFTFQGKVIERSFRGSTCTARVEAGGVSLVFEFPSILPIPDAGSPVGLSLDPAEGIQVLPEEPPAHPSGKQD